MATSAVASAFCRTTTVHADAGYNPAVSGCWTEGVPLAWPVAKVPYALGSAASKQVSLADATRVADLAFNAWNTAQCDGHPPSVQAYDDGPLAVPDLSGDALAAWAFCSESTSCDAMAHDVIVFDDDVWPYNDAVNTLALTTVTFGVDDGRIFEAYTEVNSAQKQLTIADPPPPGGQAYDLRAILTHEAGHFLGIAHATSTSAIMYAYYQPGAIDLTPDDVAAICTVYPPQFPQGGGGCRCGNGGNGPATGALGVGLSLAALRLVRRRRA
jgi:Matrixin